MGKFAVIFAGLFAVLFTGCDLQPKITSLPDSVGDFISTRYPALLADPETQPEIYNSAVTDYGVYAAPELYGTDSAAPGDYMLYADAGDYAMPAQEVVYGGEIIATPADIPAPVAETGTVVAVPVTAPSQEEEEATPPPAPEAAVAQEEVAAPEQDAPAQDEVDIISVPERDSYLAVPMYGGVQDTPPPPAQEKPADIEEKPAAIAAPQSGHVIVARGDTLYGIAHANGLTVEQVAAANNLTAPYNLRVGQDLVLPEKSAPVVAAKTVAEAATNAPAVSPAPAKAESKPAAPATTTKQEVAPATTTQTRGTRA